MLKKDIELVNYQSNDFSLTGLPLTEFQYNVLLVSIHFLNKYKDNPVLILDKEKNKKEFCNEITFPINFINEFRVTKDRQRLENNLKELLGIIVKDLPIKGKEHIDKFSVLFTSSSYNHKDKTISVSFNSNYMIYFRNLKNKYNQYFLREAIMIPGKYSKALYLALSVHLYRGDWLVSVKNLRKILCLLDSYKNSHISDKIILPLQKFLKDNKSSFLFEFQTIKEKRKIVSFKFYKIKNKKLENKKQGNLLEHYSEELLFSKFIQDFTLFIEKNNPNEKEFNPLNFEKLKNLKGFYNKKLGVLNIVLENSEDWFYIDSIIYKFKNLYYFIANKYFINYKKLEYSSATPTQNNLTSSTSDYLAPNEAKKHIEKIKNRLSGNNK